MHLLGTLENTLIIAARAIVRAWKRYRRSHTFV